MVHHGRGLRQLLKDDDLHASITADWRTANLSDARRTMLDYVVKLTHTPADMNEADVVRLRTVGFDDRDILDIVEVAAYYAYVNRIADALGVEPDEDWYDD